jgi:hypothetical protein
MTEPRRHVASRDRLREMLRDVHFWVPVAVLVGGLLVLRGIR